jgi:hypothetical protein
MTLQNQIITGIVASTTPQDHQVRLHEPFPTGAWRSFKKVLAFAWWLLIGFVAAACLRHYPQTALLWGWIYIWVLLYTFVTLLFDVSTPADAGDTWAPIVRDLPAVVSVEVQTLHDPRHPSHSSAHARRRRTRGHARRRAAGNPAKHPRHARSEVPHIARHDARSHHAEAPPAGSLLRLRNRHFTGPARCTVAGKVTRGEEPFFIVGAIAGG